MEIVLRLSLPPLVVLLAGLAQHRLGARLSGRLIGLPLTSGPFLVVLLHARGADAAAQAAGGVVAGQLTVVVMAGVYATAARGRAPAAALLCAVPGAALAAASASLLGSPLVATAVAASAALLALAIWRPGQPVRVAHRAPGAAELAARAVVTGGLVAGLTLGASVLGAHLAGLLAAVPLVIAVMAPATHTRAGASAARAMLRGTVGVVPGTIVFAVLLGATLGVVPSGTAFALAVASLLAVNHAVARLDTALPRKWVKGPREYESQGPFG